MNQLNQSLGKLVSFSKLKNGIRLEMDNAFADVVVYRSNTIRIHIRKILNFDDFSYAVVAKPKKVDFELEDLPGHLLIKTDKLQLRINKTPVRLILMDTKRNVVNEDDPAFGTSWLGAEVTTYKKLQEGERFIGLGEKTRNLDRRGQGFTNWNTDAFGYGAWDDPLYLSTPFYMGLHHDLVYGVYLDNTHRTNFNFGASNNRFSSFAAEAGEMNYYLFHDQTVTGIIEAYTQLTGNMPMPPKWSLGYQQCRYSYYPEQQVMDVARSFREKQIPCDVIYLDIHYMKDYKVFTWDKKRFPNPKKMIEELKKLGFQVVIIADPGIKIEPTYKTYREGVKKDLFVTYPDGEPYAATVWPGDCHFPDFTKEETRKWWGEQFLAHVEEGLEGFWNDMNEPATWGQMMPELIEFDYDGRKANHKKARNVYGMQMARSTFEGTKSLMKNKRPFILTRSGFSGIQRFATVWTGDNVANDESMMLGVRLVNSLGLTGIPFSGYDVGGFVGETDVALYIRWMTIAAFAPFFRGHTMINTRSSEPWSYGEEAEDIARNYIDLRYRLMPYIYNAFYEASTTGMPVARSLAIEHTHDAQIYSPDFQDQYMFGPAILVAPVESNKDIAKVYLPKGNWYYLYNDEKFGGGKEILIECPKDKLPVFVKGGSIIPMQSLTQYTRQSSSSQLSIHLYKGSRSETYEHYEDDGVTYDFERGKYLKRTFTYQPRDRRLNISSAKGSYPSKFKTVRMYLHGFPARKTLKINGNNVIIQKEDYVFIGNISNFDPFSYLPDTNRVINELPYVEFTLLKRATTIQW